MLKMIKFRLKKVIAGMLAAVTIFLSVFHTYSFPVYATEVAATFVLTEELIALIQMFYASMGLVVPKEEIAASQLTNYFTEIMNAGSRELSYYGEALTVDWSDEESIKNFVDLSMSRQIFIEGNLVEAYGPEAAILHNILDVNLKCYELFGQSGTEAIFGDIIDLKDDNGKVIGQAAWSEATQSGYIMEYNKLGQMLHNFNNGDNGDDWKTKLKKFVAYGGLSLCLFAEAAGITNFIGKALTPPETAFTEYTSESFGEFLDSASVYYDGSYDMVGSQYTYTVHSTASWTNPNNGQVWEWEYFNENNVPMLTNNKVAGYYEVSDYWYGNKVYTYYYDGVYINPFSLSCVRNGWIDDRQNEFNRYYVTGSSNYADYFHTSGAYSCNFPVFSSYEDMEAFLKGNIGDENCINKVMPFDFQAYQDFLNTVPASAMARSLINNISASNYGINETAFNTLSEEIEKIATNTDPTYTVGTEPGTNDLGKLFDDLKGDPLDDPVIPSNPGDTDTDPDVGGDITDDDEIGGSVTDYSGTLSDILGAVTALPSQIFDAFKSMLETMNENIMQIPEDIKNFFRDPIVFIQDAFTELNQSVSDMFDFMKTMPVEIAEALNLQDVIDAVEMTVFDPSSVIDSIGDLKEAITNPLDDISNTLKGILDGLPFAGSGVTTGGGGSGEAETPGVEFGSLFRILILLILIILMLIVLFMNCLKFIVMIFKIPATSGFLPEEMVMAIDYLKQLEITGLNISVYDFAFFLIDMMIIFAVIKLLRSEIVHFRIPRRRY